MNRVRTPPLEEQAARRDRILSAVQASRSADISGGVSIRLGHGRPDSVLSSPPFMARTWLESTTARGQSRRAAAFGSAPAAPRATAPRRRPRSSPATAAGTSCPNRSPTPAAGTPTGRPCAARTRCRTAPSGQAAGSAPGAGNSAPCTAEAARSAPTSRPRRSTAKPPCPATAELLTRTRPPRPNTPCVSRCESHPHRTTSPKRHSPSYGDESLKKRHSASSPTLSACSSQ